MVEWTERERCRRPDAPDAEADESDRGWNGDGEGEAECDGIAAPDEDREAESMVGAGEEARD